MKPFEAALLTYILNSLWQVPLIFAAAWLAARAVRRIGPAIEHRVWVTALFLEVLLPACSVTPSQIVHTVSQLIPHSDRIAPSSAHATAAIETGHALNLPQIPPSLAAAILLLYLSALTFFVARFLWAFRKTIQLTRASQPIVLSGTAALTWTRCCNLFSVHNAHAAVSSGIRFPMTLGLRRRRVLLPTNLPDALLTEDLDAAIAHEFAHMQRRDFAKNLAYNFLSLPVAFHPLLWLTRTRLDETREIVCDTMAANVIAGSQNYARSLLRLATLLAPPTRDTSLHAIGIFNTSIFERRIMTLTHHRTSPRTSTRIGAAAACVVLGIAACTSALALRIPIPIQQAPDASTPALSTASTSTHPVVIFSKPPEYPAAELAKKEKFTGNVEVSLIVGKDGIPTKVSVVQSLRPDFDQKAVEAVQQYRFKPATLDGKPVASRLFIDVNFQTF